MVKPKYLYMLDSVERHCSYYTKRNCPIKIVIYINNINFSAFTSSIRLYLKSKDIEVTDNTDNELIKTFIKRFESDSVSIQIMHQVIVNDVYNFYVYETTSGDIKTLYYTDAV